MTSDPVNIAAGLLSTFPPFENAHPSELVPMAEAVLSALHETGWWIMRPAASRTKRSAGSYGPTGRWSSGFLGQQRKKDDE